MRNTARMSIIALILTLGLVSFATAQMMNNSKQGSATDNNAGSHSGTMMNRGKMNDSMGTMRQQQTMMMTDFDKIEKNIGTMMQSNNMTTLKSDLKDLQSMVMSMRKQMAKNMPANMNSNHMNGRMGSSNMMNGQMGSNRMSSGMMGMNSQQSSKTQNKQSGNR
ncbi:MAG TPA: hypothetical protein VJ983_07905 [candidate division Zixibacteria bacterium]|nr:hypothetical protein [candidate division Zixibacteria bacterium]